MLDTNVIIPNTLALVFDLDREFSVHDGRVLLSDLIAIANEDDVRIGILGEVAYVLNYYENDAAALAAFREVVSSFTTTRLLSEFDNPEEGSS